MLVFLSLEGGRNIALGFAFQILYFFPCTLIVGSESSLSAICRDELLYLDLKVFPLFVYLCYKIQIYIG